MAVLLLMAMDLPKALPPTVIPATRADIKSCTARDKTVGMPMTAWVAMTAEAEPEMTPQISPTTSLQKEETRYAFRSSRMASVASGIFFAAME